MYVLKINLYLKDKLTVFIQLRDSDMRLIAFFQPKRLEQILKSEGLVSHLSAIENSINIAKTGKLLYISTTL